MSAETVRQVLVRAVAEPDFRARLQLTPGEALAGYDLDEEETEALVALPPEGFNHFIAVLETRESRALPLPTSLVQPTGF